MNSCKGRPIRALHFTPDLVYYGGGPQMLKLLTEYTDPAACEMTLCALGSNTGFSLRDRPEARVLALDLAKAPLARKLRAFAALVQNEKPDILHSYGNICTFLAAVVGTMRRIPVVVWEIGLDIYGNRRLPQLSDNITEWFVTERICNSCATLKARQAKILLPHARWSVQGRGVPDRAIYRDPLRAQRREALRRELGLGEQDTALATIGGFIALRDHATTLRALARVKAEGRRVRAYFVGDGPLRLEVQSLAQELGVLGDVIFLGYKKEAAELLPAMDIYVNGAYAEGFGIATVEALLCGLPVIAADAAANSELIEQRHTGLLVPPRNPEALAQVISELITHPELGRRLGHAGRETSLDLFAPERLANAHLAICRRVLGLPEPA